MKCYIVTEDNTEIEFADDTAARSYIAEHNHPYDIFYRQEDVPAKTSFDIFQEKLSQGYPIPNTPYFLAMQDEDRAQFSAMLAMINEAFRYGYATGSTMTEIKDKDGHIIPISMGDFQQLMIAYGSYYIQLWSAKNAG